MRRWLQTTKGLAAIEALAGSAAILLVGFATIPLAAHLAGANVSAGQGAAMGLMFFAARWAWLFALRLFMRRFDKAAP